MLASEKLLQLLSSSRRQRISPFLKKKKNGIKVETYTGTDEINLVAAGCFNEICSAPSIDGAHRRTDTDCSEAQKLLILKAA